MSGLEDLELYRPLLTHARGVYVMADQWHIWVSDDARRWDVVASPDDGSQNTEIKDLVAGEFGFIAVGTQSIDADDDGSPDDSRALVLTSSDGRNWKRLTDWRFDHGAMNLVGMSRQGIVAFGYSRNDGASLWTSPDGVAWIKATNESGLEVAGGVQVLAESGGRLTAFVATRGQASDNTGPVEVWQTEGRADWTKVGQLPDPADTYVHRAAFGGGRWLALGFSPSGRAWSSSDGAHWVSTTPPEGAYAIAGWPGGLILAGSTGAAPGDTCSGNEPYVGRTWLSAEPIWQALAPTPGAAILALVVADGRVLGIGQRAEGRGGAAPIGWNAALPGLPVEPIPTPKPSPTPQYTKGCGG